MDLRAPAAATPGPPSGSAPTRSAVIAFALLLAAACAAFFLAARLKAEPAVLKHVARRASFSPNGDGRKDREPIRFRLKKTDDVAIEVIDRDGERVRRLTDRLHAPADQRVRITWDGLDDDGQRAPDGAYRIRLILRREGRSVVAPAVFELDTRPPSPAVLVDREQGPIVSPGQPVRFRTRGVGPRAKPRLRVLRTDVEPVRSVREIPGVRGRRGYTWDGRLDDGSAAPPGTYLISVSSRDAAGNEGSGPRLPLEPGTVEGRPGVTVRGLAVQPPVRPVRAGALVAFRVDARGRSYRWQVRRVGAARPVKRNRRRKTATTLVFRAPNGISGVYLLEVRSGRYATRVPFAVQAIEPARVTVVLPTITWLGRDPLDEAAKPDGIPNVLANGSVVPFPRPFAGEDGLPAGFAKDVAPLLVFLDRSRVRYDLQTDLALALADEPPDPDAGGLLFAGAPEWVSRGLARRLRRFVVAGGRVALFGPRALRAGVTVGDGKLTHATPAGPTDALGGRLAPLRSLPETDGQVPPLAVLEEKPATGFFDGRPGAGMFDGFSGDLPGFVTIEELVAPGRDGELIASLGQPLGETESAEAEDAGRTPREPGAALGAVRQGEGLVIRVGIPGWVERLERADATIAQLTRNVVDLLRGVRPRPRSAPR